MRKQDVLDEIAAVVGIARASVSAGSTEPKEFLARVALAIGIECGVKPRKADIAKSIVEASGRPWLPTYSSTGSTITLDGLVAIRDSVVELLG
jgi:hypothetical protein